MSSSEQALLNRRQAESILSSLAMFLCIGGMNTETAARSFKAAFKRARLKAKNLQVQHIGHPTHFADILTAWTKSQRYLDAMGRPAILPLKGKVSFASLLRESSPQANAKDVLAVFLRYGNVKRARNGKLLLVKPFFVSTTPQRMAFEPIAYFLSDASVTLRRILDHPKMIKGPAHFWRKVENAHLSNPAAKQFIEFAKERTLMYLEELDDWLEAHKSNGTNGKAKRRRVGVGVFSVYSDIEPYDSGG